MFEVYHVVIQGGAKKTIDKDQLKTENNKKIMYSKAIKINILVALIMRFL